MTLHVHETPSLSSVEKKKPKDLKNGCLDNQDYRTS